ncbi:MAG: hypothetical protein K2W95_33615 [Candidatus Obscuribacterales bacterium]|nr:hypothetical protein [Candidatus Obscuribacterales bacterium]
MANMCEPVTASDAAASAYLPSIELVAERDSGGKLFSAVRKSTNRVVRPDDLVTAIIEDEKRRTGFGAVNDLLESFLRHSGV